MVTLTVQQASRINLQALFVPVSAAGPAQELVGDAVYPSYRADGQINNLIPLPKRIDFRTLNNLRFNLVGRMPSVTVDDGQRLLGDAIYPSYRADGLIGFLEVEVADAVYPTYEAEGLIASGNVEMRSTAPMAYATFRVRVNNRRRKVMFVVNR